MSIVYILLVKAKTSRKTRIVFRNGLWTGFRYFELLLYIVHNHAGEMEKLTMKQEYLVVRLTSRR